MTHFKFFAIAGDIAHLAAWGVWVILSFTVLKLKEINPAAQGTGLLNRDTVAGGRPDPDCGNRKQGPDRMAEPAGQNHFGSGAVLFAVVADGSRAAADLGRDGVTVCTCRPIF